MQIFGICPTKDVGSGGKYKGCLQEYNQEWSYYYADNTGDAPPS